MNVWDKIYSEKQWGEGSGAGSTVETTQKYVEVVNEYLLKYKAPYSRVSDIGCGLWSEWQKALNLDGWEYFGFDECESVIQRNQKINSPGKQWHHGNPLRYLVSLGEADGKDHPSVFQVALVKDVFQHLSFISINQLLACLKKNKALIITNDSVLDGVNRDCEDGGYRPIDLRLPPFNLKPNRVVDYPSSPHQKTMLIFERH